MWTPPLSRKTRPTAKIFARADSLFSEDATITRYASYSTGMMIAFRTDSPIVAARWKTSERPSGANMTPIFAKGLDLYIRVGDEWHFAGSGRPTYKGSDLSHHKYTLVRDMNGLEKACLLYLPAFDYVDSLSIGIAPGSSIAPMENPFRHMVIFQGSSITHGASASRPGATYVARFGRMTGLYTPNLGFSGSSKLQEEFAHFLAGTPADAIVMDAFSNPSAEEIRSRFDRFVDILRAAKPDIPLIFMQTETRDQRRFDLKLEEWEAAKQEAAREVVTRRMQQDKNMYFIDSARFFDGVDIPTIDGDHPTDSGFDGYLRVLVPEITAILDKYDIR